MKKIIKIFSIVLVLSIVAFNGNTYAIKLSSFDAQLSNTKVMPGEDVTLTVNFGENLSEYNISVSYDKNIFEYVSVDAGTVMDTGDKVKVSYESSVSKTNMTVKFRAKSDITTSNPTEFLITAEGLTNFDNTVLFDDITMPIMKNLVVEPEFVDYILKLQYVGEIIKNEGKEMTISYSSPAGKYYENARLIATATTPENGNVQILAIDQAGLEYDIIKSGWGDAQGFNMGGKNYAQVLQTKAIFSDGGKYNISLKLIDRDNSDSIIAENSFEIIVLDEEIQEEPIQPFVDEVPLVEERSDENVVNSVKSENITNTEVTANVQIVNDNVVTNEQMPKTLPKTGTNIYFVSIIILIALFGGYIYYEKKK